MIIFLVSVCIGIIILIIAQLLGTALSSFVTIMLCGASTFTISGGVNNRIDDDNMLYGSDAFGGDSDIITKAEAKLSKIVKQHEKKYKNVKYDPTPAKSSGGNRKSQTDESELIDINLKYMDIAIDVFKQEGVNYDYLSDFDVAHWVKYSGYNTNEKAPDYDTILKFLKIRTLTDDYPHFDSSAIYSGYNLKSVEYYPKDKEEFEKFKDNLIKFEAISYIRELTDSERQETRKMYSDFNSGKLTKPEMTLYFRDGTKRNVLSCVMPHDIKYSNGFKRVHWGQRKLLLSEIDLFNRVALEMGVEKFKKDKISVVYPGAAHGNHLMILMDMYPNIIFYLWDPARYNTILYIADFLRRKLPIKFRYTETEMNLAKKYVNRVFINMELTNDEFIIYHENSTTDNIKKNYITQHGFFVENSANVYNSHKKNNNDDSVTIFISDIRLFTFTETSNLLYQTNMRNVHDLYVIKLLLARAALKDYERDMTLQHEWFNMVNAEYGLFKFKLKMNKLAVSDLYSEYFDGDIVLQTWAPFLSTETRLFVKPKKSNDKTSNVKTENVAHDKAYYNIYNYDNGLEFFNSVLRLHSVSDMKLSELGITVADDTTMYDIWKHFLYTDMIAMDSVLQKNNRYSFC
jgi:hypothetical protein